MLTRLLAAVLALLVITPLGVSRDAAQENQEEPHWAIQLGMRVQAVEQAFPLIDRVVLVPDPATYLDELAKWSPRGRWPVLIEDDRYAPMFIRRFTPSEVIRRESVGELLEDDAALRTRLDELLVRIWGGEAASQSLRTVFALHQFDPPGVVIASAGDSAWTAAIALAAGRGQPVVWMDDRLGSPNSVARRETASDFREHINESLGELGWDYRDLGDTIDAITICRAIAGKVNLPRHDNGELEPAAMTDYLGRHADGSRYAFVGWIFGDETRSAYIAMCSLFLPRDSFTLVNGYPNEGPWQSWNVDPAAGLLGQRGYNVAVHNGSKANEAGWLEMIQNGVSTDVFVVNSKGNVDFFDLAGDDRMTAFDVPLLNHPAVVHFTHSWSMRLPENDTTIAGGLLDAGAYAYVGAVHEPLLPAFVPPLPLAQRWASAVPVLVAARHWEAPQPFGGPWKVGTFGDPLMIALPAAMNTKERLASSADYGVRLNDVVRETMRQVEQDESGAAIADSIALLELLGRDEIAVQLWRLAQQRDVSESAAAAALGPLFRHGTPEEFLAAWQENGMRGKQRALDMLWHKMTPMISAIRDEDVLLMLQGSLRRPHSQGDLSRLAPHVSRVFGADQVRSIIEREMDRTDNRRAKRALQQLLRRY